MTQFIDKFDEMMRLFIQNLPYILNFLAVFWGVHLVNVLFKGRLSILGIYPRHWFGLLGIVCAPFLHRDWGHLIMNSLMFVILGMMVLFLGKSIFWAVTVEVVLLSGIGIWLLGRRSIHIGASALVMGYFGFLLVEAYYRPTFVTFIIAAVCLYYFGGMFANLFPQGRQVSWEGHLIGFGAGIGAVYSYPYVVPYTNHIMLWVH